MNLIHLTLTCFAAAFICAPAAAQEQAPLPTQLPAGTPPFRSTVDAGLSVRRVGVLPVTDNVGGVYARPVEDRLKDLVRKSQQWDLTDTPVVGSIMNTSELEDDPTTVQNLGASFKVDALISARASKNPNGITLIVDLFLAKDGVLFLQESIKDYPHFETFEVQKLAEDLLRKLVSHMPYRGTVLSRTTNKVTLNLGAKEGIKKDQVLNAILILGVQRHPKFHFMVTTEKEILGRIRIDKAEETLSFGTILSEKERGTIQKGTKLLDAEGVVYEDSNVPNGDAGDPSHRLAFGEKPEEWVPTAPPTFGRIGFKFGLGSYTANAKLANDTSLSSQVPVYPNLSLFGELWLTQEWIVRANLQQGVASISNPLGGSSPSSLNLSLAHYSLYVGYNFLLKNDFFGPKIQTLVGFSQTSAYVDASSPLGFTSTSYSGLSLGVSAEFPLNISKEKDKYDLGVALYLFVKPGLSETPETSGSSADNTINQFSLFGSMKLGEHLRGIASLDLELYSTTFSGAGSRAVSAQNSSERITMLDGGLEYSF